MELLNEKIFNSESFAFLSDFFNTSHRNTYTYYQRFKMTIMRFAKEIMKNYLNNTIYQNDGCYSFIYENINSYGLFNPDLNAIFIKETIIKNLYEKKDLGALVTLFHELNHFKIKYDIKLGYINEHLVRVVKEDLISKTPLVPFFIKCKEEYDNTYYKDNYQFYSEEKIADIASIENVLLFAKKANINLTPNQINIINNCTHKYNREYKNYLRDVSNNMHFNSYVIDFEEAFDILIKNNPDWLEYWQLHIEYYLNENNEVLKRSRDELISLYNKETNDEIKKYIKYLISTDIKKSNYANNKKSVLKGKIDFKNINNYLYHK